MDALLTDTTIIITLALWLGAVLSQRSGRVRAGQAWPLKSAAAVQLVCSMVLALIVSRSAMSAAASLPAPTRYAVWGMALAGVVGIGVNGLSGLWLLSPLARIDPGMEVHVAGRRGVVAGYGWMRLQLATRAGWSVHVPYLSIALRPLGARRRVGGQLVELSLRRDHWGDEELRFLRQAVVLSPYRDLSMPVEVSHRSSVVRVRLGVIGRAADGRLRRQLERTIAERTLRPWSERPPES